MNVITLTIMLKSGLRIFNAHPALYWGATSKLSHPLLSMYAMQDNQDHG